MKTRQKLSDWALWVFISKWVYGMGCYGQRLQAQYATLAKSWYYTVKNPSGFKKLTARYQAGENPRLYDCHGILDGFRMDDDQTAEIDFDPSVDTSADYEMNRVKSTGKLGVDYGPIDAAMKDNAGYGYWKSGHFGIGVGNGEVVDIWSTGDPARKRDQTLGSWTYWLKCYDIYYGDGDIMIEQSTVAKPEVYDLQTIYVKLGYDIGQFKNMYDPTILDGRDGKFGSVCIGITKQIQSKHGLPQTGNVDAVTYGKIGLDLAAQTAADPALIKQLEEANKKILALNTDIGQANGTITNLQKTIGEKDETITQKEVIILEKTEVIAGAAAAMKTLNSLSI